MKNLSRRCSAAFTLVEIMIVVAIIGLLAVIAVPGFIKSRQLAQGRALLNEARQVDAAIDHWALENGRIDGDPVNSASVSLYLKAGPLQSKVAALGSGGGAVNAVLTVNSLSIGNVGSAQVTITTSAKSLLPAMTDWGHY
jgi:prepilin-type N-terminal cleavage/methylation domain-containing protein